MFLTWPNVFVLSATMRRSPFSRIFDSARAVGLRVPNNPRRVSVAPLSLRCLHSLRNRRSNRGLLDVAT